MRPPRTPSASPDAPAGGAAPVALPFSGELTVRDHARLAERLADDIGRLRQARLSHHDFPQVRDRLEAFLTDDLIPYLHAEEAALSKAADRPHRRGWWGSRRPRRRLREHRRVIDAAHALRRADTPVLPWPAPNASGPCFSPISSGKTASSWRPQGREPANTRIDRQGPPR